MTSYNSFLARNSSTDKRLLKSNVKNLNIFGKFKNHLVNSVSKTINCESVKKNGASGLTTVIEKTETTTKKSNDQQGNHLNQQLSDGTIYAIVLPHILDINHQNIVQPILIQVDESEFEDFGFSLPFAEFLSKSKNCFKLKLKNSFFYVEIVAIGYSPLDLKVSLEENSRLNSSWKNLPRMKRCVKSITPLIHCPLESDNDIPTKRVLSDSEILDLFGPRVTSNTPDQRETRSSIELEFCEKVDLERNGARAKDPNEKNPMLADGERTHGASVKRLNTNERESINKIDPKIDQSIVDSSFEQINEKVNKLLQRKAFFTEIDTTGSTFLQIIDTLSLIRDHLNEKQQNQSMTSITVPEFDATYKNTAKRQIFIEGMIRLDMDLYDSAMKQATPGEPPSFAYQMIRIAFPKSYWENVTLGKRYIDKKSHEKLLESIEKNVTINQKYPLSLIWGFKEPHDERMKGSFDYKLGQDRVRAFINHCFRKSHVFTYSIIAEKKVRQRMIKELCARNTSTTVCMVQDSDNLDTGPQDEDQDPNDPFLSNQESSTLKKRKLETLKAQDLIEKDSQTQDRWNLDCFEDLY